MQNYFLAIGWSAWAKKISALNCFLTLPERLAGKCAHCETGTKRASDRAPCCHGFMYPTTFDPTGKVYIKSGATSMISPQNSRPKTMGNRCATSGMNVAWLSEVMP